MTEQRTKRSPLRFYVAFAIVALLIAGLLSYFADSAPDGLDSVTQNGCTEQANGQLQGNCIAQHATGHHMSGSPLADYTVDGNDGLTGVAGIIGVAITLMVAGGLFWVVRRRRPSRTGGDSDSS